MHGRYSLASTLPGHRAQRGADGLQWASRYASRSDCSSPAQLHGTELAASPGCYQLNDADVRLCRGLRDAACKRRTFTSSRSCRTQALGACYACFALRWPPMPTSRVEEQTPWCYGMGGAASFVNILVV